MLRTALRVFAALLLAATTSWASPASAGQPPDPPTEQAAASVQADGQTVISRDQTGTEVWQVFSGWDLDQYLYRASNPLNFAIDVNRHFGPVDINGHPAPGNGLFGLTGRITLRVWDVDEDGAPGFTPEVDEVYVNGFLLGTLSGANDQWSVNTFEFPLSHLLLPTASNPNGRNEFEVIIDTTAQGWAVTVDFAALRLKPAPVPLAFVHGLGGSGAIWTGFQQYVDNNTNLEPAQLVAPTHSSTNFETSAAEIAGPIGSMMAANGVAHTNIISHSLGGLVSRLYAWDNPAVVDNLIMIGTPNGGSSLAAALCIVKAAGPGFGPVWLVELFDDQFGDCHGPDDALYQLQPFYVQDTFNIQVPDRHGTTYTTISGILPDEGRTWDLIPGADDELVALASSQYLWVGNPDHPGKHLILETLPLQHNDLILQNSGAMPASVCWLYGDRCEAQAAPIRSSAVTSSSDFVMGRIGTVEVPAGGTGVIDLDFEGQSNASVIVISDHLSQITPTLAGATFEPSSLFESDVLAANLVSPAGGQLQISNLGTEAARVVALVALPGGRNIEVDTTDSLVGPGSEVGISVTLSEAGVAEPVAAEVRAPSGLTVPVPLSEISPEVWTANVTPSEPGIHSVTAWVNGPRPRYNSTGFTVSSGQALVTGAYTERLEGVDDGLADELVISPSVSIMTAGRYRLSGQLADTAGTILASAGAVAELPSGTSSLDLAFSGRALFEGGVDGQYRIVNVVLSRDDAGMVLEDRVDFLGLTQAYNHRTFDHFPVLFDLGAFTDEAVDIDTDGIDDELRVTGSVAVDADGTYAINARLVAPDRTEVGEFEAFVSLSAGFNAFTLTFDGDAIAATGLDGPYLVEDLSIYSVANASLLGYLLGAHETAAYTAAQFGALTDTTPPVSQAGPLNSVYTSSTVAVPYTANDTGGSGISTVELWVRYRSSEARSWQMWALATSGSVSPLPYTFADGDGRYEFYTVAIDNDGNREPAPPTADAETHRDAVDDPPENYFSSISTSLTPCEPSCTKVAFHASGTAADDRSAVSVKWRLWGEKDDGSTKRLFNFKAATPSDGAFDEATEQYVLSDERNPAGYVAYWVDVQLTAGGQAIVVSTRVPISSCSGLTLVPC